MSINTRLAAPEIAYILKDCAAKVLLVDPELAPAIDAVRGDLVRNQQKSAADLLTGREREVLAGIAKGRTNKEIGAELGISHRTVETHRESLMRKLRIRTVAGLTKFALETGLVGE